MRHFTIPIFIPELACPNRCVFCNQQKISGKLTQPTVDEVHKIIQAHLKTLPKNDSHIDIGFFGGNFTGISAEVQERYLQSVQQYLQTNQIQEIKLSTRPDYIDNKKLDLLKKYRVSCIELGAQSLDHEVLQASGRGHSVEDVERASDLIQNHGFELGLQMMIGLPLDTFEKSVDTAKKIVSLGAKNTRIYPTLVITDALLADLYRNGNYEPLSLNQAIDWVVELLPIFETASVKVLRIGLHPSEGLLNGDNLLAGPFHPAFGQLVESKYWGKRFEKELLQLFKYQIFKNKTLTIQTATRQRTAAIGFRAENKKELAKYFKEVHFVENSLFTKHQFCFNISG